MASRRRKPLFVPNAGKGWTLTEIVKDDGASGKNLDRPGFQHALELIASGQADGLVASKLDRISRSVVDFGMVLQWFDAAGASLSALDLAIDTATPGGRLVANVFASVAEWERETIAQRTRDGLAAKRVKGEGAGRPSVRDNPNLARYIRSLRDEGLTLRAIAERLNDEGVPTLRGAQRWGVSSVQTALGYKRPKAHKPAALPPLPRRRMAA